MKKFAVLIIVMVISMCTGLTSFAGEYLGDWSTDERGTRYLYDDGSYPSSCFIRKDRKLYYFNQDGYLASNVALFNGYQTDSDGSVIGYTTKNEVYASIHSSSGWTQDNNGWWYQFPDGTYPKNVSIKVDGKTYWLGTDGYMLHDCYARDHGYYGSDGSYANKLDKYAEITTKQSSKDASTKNNESTQSAEEALASFEVDDSLKPILWKKVCESAKAQLKYKNTSIFPEWNDEGITYTKNPDAGKIFIKGWCQAKNGLGNYVEISIRAMTSSDQTTIDYCEISN